MLFETDPDKAREMAREHLNVYLTPSTTSPSSSASATPTRTSTAAGGSDRLVDDLVFWGDLDTIVTKLHDHLDAGADHVGIQVLSAEPGQSAMPQWRQLAEALLPQPVR